jgi:hypothetical protein
MSNISTKCRSIRAAIRRGFTPSQAAWFGAAIALYGLWAFMVLWAAWNDVLPRFNIGNILGLISLYGGLSLVGALFLLIVSLASRLKPPYRLAFFLILPTMALFMVLTWVQGAAIGLFVLLGGVSLFFGAAASLLAKHNWRTGSTVWLLCGTAILILGLYALLAPTGDLNPTLVGYHLQGHTLALPDPGQRGSYQVATFTYGSGKDLHRPEYGKPVRFITRTVDGSKLDTQWTGLGGWLRTRYWGFDAAHMPLQGRVWMPGGTGPFPLVAIVHGNHAMEESSDSGYAYLGEHLASQGFIFVSIDENFLNSSGADWTDLVHLRLGKENGARAWLLLEHLAQWRRWAADASNPLYGKVDMDRIALIGHSRGGEAVALANALNELDYFPDDATVPFNFHFNLRGIAAIAPSDGMYRLRASDTPMRDQNYLVIQGTLDGDIRSFAGASQYSRASFSGKVDAFKASVYVKNANHGQFNTAWGRNDSGHSYKFLIDERHIMKGTAQRQTAIVYLSAFLGMTLKDEVRYRPLLEDARNGAAWLPDTYIVNNYADSRTLWIANYEEDIDPATGSEPGITIAGNNLTVWTETEPDINNGHLCTHLALLAWDDRFHGEKRKSYKFDFSNPIHASQEMDLVFSASQAEIDTLPRGFNVPGPRRNEDKTPLDWTIVLSDANAQEARLSLSSDQVLYPQLKGETRRAGVIDGLPKSELVMRQYCFALKDFLAVNPNFALDRLKEIRFEFDRSRRGAIALDDVGLSPER